MDECLEPEYCEHGRCENFIGGFNCRCDSGYVRSDNKKTCVGKRNIIQLYLHRIQQRSNAARVRNMSRFDGGELPENSKHFLKSQKINQFLERVALNV